MNVKVSDISWYEKYRPQSIDEMMFESDEQEKLCKELMEDIRSNLLFAGPPGTGKTTFARILIKHHIKSPHDIFKVVKRSVSEIDEISKWIHRRPVSSKTKIVYIEEIDRISREAQGTLKNEIMEFHLKTTKFIATTNWIGRLDPALVSRFTVIEFSGKYRKSDLLKRIKKILDNEGAIYDEAKLEQFVNSLSDRVDVRSLLTALQISYLTNDKKIDFDNLQTTTRIESEIVETILSIMNKLMNTSHDERFKAMIQPLNSTISQEYAKLVSLLAPNLQYESILIDLYESIDFPPLKLIVGQYVNNIQWKQYPHIHVLACFYEMVRCLANLYW